MFSRQKKERPVLPGVGRLELVAEPEPPLLLELQPTHRLPQGATISADHTQGGACIGPEGRSSVTKMTRPFESSSWYLVWIRTFKERELLQEARSHKGVSETEEKAAEEQPTGADVDRVGLGTGETHRRLRESNRDLVLFEATHHCAKPT